MTDIYTAITGLIGPVPDGFEGVAWVVCALVLLYLVNCGYSILGALINRIATRR